MQSIHAPPGRLALVALVAIVLLAAALLVQEPGSEGPEVGDGLLIVVTYPGLEADIAMLVCPQDRVVPVYEPGVDPHDLQLDPEKARLIEEADIVVTMGHTPADMKAGELARGIVFNVLELPGLILLRIPGDGVNPHYPIYHPNNYLLFIDRLTRTIEEVATEKGVYQPGEGECSYTGKMLRVDGYLRTVSEPYWGALSGEPAVLDLPATQYVAEWLGVEVELLLSTAQGHAGEALDPRILGEARRLLDEGAIAFVTVDDTGAPVSPIGSWLMEEARSLGADMVLVKAPYTQGSVVDKLRYVAGQLED